MLMSVEDYTAFFEELNRTMEGTNALADCDHTLTYTLSLLKGRMPDYRETLEKIVDLGGHCDCEVLLNARPSEYAARRLDENNGPNIMGNEEWGEFIEELILSAQEEN